MPSNNYGFVSPTHKEAEVGRSAPGALSSNHFNLGEMHFSKRDSLRLHVMTLLACLILATGCVTEPERLASIEGQQTSDNFIKAASCLDGVERNCSITLDLVNDVATCLRGQQTCEDGNWSVCSGDAITREPFHHLKPEGVQRKALSLSGSVTCSDPSSPFFNACDPSCLYFLEDPVDVKGAVGVPSVPLTTPSYGGECSTDVCQTTDEPRVDGCSPCISTVCAAQPTCCDAAGAWNAECVSAAGLLCAGVTVTPGLCDYGLFADVKIETRNRPSSNASIASYGDIIVGTDSGIVAGGIFSKGNIDFMSLNGRPVIAPLGIRADGHINSQNSNSPIDADLYAGTSISIPGWKLDPSKTVNAQGNIIGQNGTKIPGWANTNGSLINFNPSDLGTVCEGAGCYTHSPVVLPPQTAGTAIPIFSTDCSGGTNFYSSGGNTTVPGPGTYRNLNINNNGNLTLNGEGTYFFREFEFDGGSITLEPDQGGSVGWDIRVCQKVELKNGTKIRGGTGLANDSNGVLLDNTLLMMYSDSSSALSWQTDVYFSGMFIAPHAKLSKSNVNNPPSEADINSGVRAAPINGAIWAKELYLDTGAMTYQIDQASCERIVPTGAGSCSAPGTQSGTQAALLEPCSSGRDCQVNHRCEEPITGGSCSHSKCQAGGGLDANCDECVARICAEDASCCAGNWTSACVDKVATTCDATCGADGGAGSCTQNVPGDEDLTCSGYDLTLAIPCDDQLPICNHGTVDFLGDVSVGYWAQSKKQMSFENPTLPADGNCDFTNLSVPKGSCVIETCAIAAAGLHTLMVDPEQTLGAPGECNTRRLDNWTVHDRQVCPPPSTPAPVIITEDYEADCPKDTSALWNLLGWESETPGDSTITFRAIIAETAAELASAQATPGNYQELAVARSTPSDTQECGLFSNCMVDIAGELSLGQLQQGQHLGLEIAIETGTGTPVLKDWFITHSCVYDQ